MQLVILIMVNILIASIFYLVISIKLERSATEFRSKRLRKEMEELINEFNHTAERNLSLLEYKINVLRELLKRADALPQLDITIKDEIDDKRLNNKRKKKINTTNQQDNVVTFNNREVLQENIYGEPSPISNDLKNIVFDEKSIPSGTKTVHNQTEIKTAATVGEQLSEIVVILINRIKEFINSKHKQKHLYNQSKTNTAMDATSYYEVEPYTTKEQSVSAESTLPAAINDIDEDELLAMYQNADDKYLMIAKLYSQGYPLQVLSKISGIPMGEISLILNLSMKK